VRAGVRAVASAQNASQAALDDCWNRIGVHGDRSCAELKRHIHCRNCPVFSAGARSLLDVPAPLGSDQIATEHFARPAHAEYAVSADTESVIVFRLGAEWHAIRTAACLEIADLRPIHSLPHRRNGAVLGVANVRGALLVCISLAIILSVSAQPDPAPAPSRRRAAVPRLLVARGTGGTVVFPVDEVQGTERFRARDLQDVPATVAQAKAAYTRGLIPLSDKTVGLLDEQRLFHAAERALA
jgi:chemotaxis-related protein WspD